MIAVDTNVLIRALVDDPEPQHQRQLRSARKALAAAGTVYVSQIVQVELVWVLQRAYGLVKADVVSVLEHLASNAAYLLEHRGRFDIALRHYRSGPADFSDYLLLADAAAQDLQLLSFDKKLLRSTGATRPQ